MKSVNIASNEVSQGYWKPSPKTKIILTLLYIIAWIIFVGLSIEAASFITNAVFILVKPEAVPYLWQQADLRDLLQYGHVFFFTQVFIIGVVSALKAILFYLIISILHNKQVKIEQPFTNIAQRFILRIASLALLIGLFSILGTTCADWLSGQGVKMPDLQALYLSGADVWIFMSIALFVVAYVFKKGIELQTEQDLTV
ncbi:DUF2975 domain-containing protein [Niabella yanshanensis]|uniref:DUF2975 domain-containing protein n=1 Tax=Niabella yanshanensis TaxID=577386 RepID=A0ABZ0W264_9BACT|nr:DUF2975 domain-containing protein [Niabella yanshanensis]WQD37312.1 DUF2975 domain-containing protein [Niabella yanshanensis]